MKPAKCPGTLMPQKLLVTTEGVGGFGHKSDSNGSKSWQNHKKQNTISRGLG